MTTSTFDKFAHQPSSPDDLREVLKGKKVPDSSESSTDADTPDQFAQEKLALETQIKNAEEKAKENQSAYLRTLAEFENFKKRMERDKAESIQYANEKFILEMLPLFDSFEMTLTHVQNNPAINNDEEVTESRADAKNPDKKNPLYEGVELVFKQLQSTLEKFGVQIVSGEGAAFDPNLQESINMIDSADHPSGTVLLVHRKGFKLGSRLIRAALVTIAK